jgi:hypothetical protein
MGHKQHGCMEFAGEIAELGDQWSHFIGTVDVHFRPEKELNRVEHYQRWAQLLHGVVQQGEIIQGEEAEVLVWSGDSPRKDHAGHVGIAQP